MWKAPDLFKSGLLGLKEASRSGPDSATIGKKGEPSIMTDSQVLARAHHALMRGFVQAGRALHHTELARELGLTPDAARQVQRDLAASGLPIGIHPDTDYISAMGPFSSIPTHYRISVEGVQRWYAN